jgi:ATP-dependent Lon protease
MKQDILDLLIQHAEPTILVNKAVSRSLFQELNVPSYIRDWFLKDIKDYGDLDALQAVKQKMHDSIPRLHDWPKYLDLLKAGSKVKFLARVSIVFDLKKDRITFEIPEYSITSKQTYIDPLKWETFKEGLLNHSGSVWGVVELSYQDIVHEKKIEHLIFMDHFKYFAPFKVQPEHLVNLREKFTFDEWMDVLLSGIDYEPDGFQTDKEKMTMLLRLLPFVESRLNLIELAPKGTGKTYVFSQLSNRAWWANGGIVSRAKFFFDMTLKRHGLVANYDLIALDEVSTITFQNESEVQSALKGYLETGRYTVGNSSGQSTCSFILLGNIPYEHMNIEQNMIQTLPSIFNDSALLDRFHGFIEGWNIPRINESMKMKQTALSSEYFAEMFHLLRSEAAYAAIVDDLYIIPDNADTRDTTAVKRISTALIKLFFPHWIRRDNISLDELETYVLETALHMRKIIKIQMGFLDPQFKHSWSLDIQVKR